ncbi:hypothetical protein YM18_0776 [Geobacter sulfurreducens]|nr:hypothetical protein YM18_0776 [Geobacter sulfurreducens]
MYTFSSYCIILSSCTVYFCLKKSNPCIILAITFLQACITAPANHATKRKFLDLFEFYAYHHTQRPACRKITKQ